MSEIIRFVVLFPLFFISFFSFAQQDWKEQSNKDGIVTYTRAKKGSSIKEVKTVATFNASPDKILKVILDFENYPDWVYGNKSTQLLKSESSNSHIIYSEVAVPWPLQNRDVCHTVVVSKKGNTIFVQENALPSYIPEKTDLVRVKVFACTWEIVPEGNKSKVTMIIHSEPGGTVPDWVVELFVAEGPVQTFEKLRLKLK